MLAFGAQARECGEKGNLAVEMLGIEFLIHGGGACLV
jgi:hypothetical protein